MPKPSLTYHKIQVQKRGKFETFADVLGHWSDGTWRYSNSSAQADNCKITTGSSLT